MSKIRSSHSVFRFRCYKMPDGVVKEVYGDESPPVGAEWFLEDVVVEQLTTKTSNLDSPVKLDVPVAPTPSDAPAPDTVADPVEPPPAA